jgi:hypothetical protein
VKGQSGGWAKRASAGRGPLAVGGALKKRAFVLSVLFGLWSSYLQAKPDKPFRLREANLGPCIIVATAVLAQPRFQEKGSPASKPPVSWLLDNGTLLFWPLKGTETLRLDKELRNPSDVRDWVRSKGPGKILFRWQDSGFVEAYCSYPGQNGSTQVLRVSVTQSGLDEIAAEISDTKEGTKGLTLAAAKLQVKAVLNWYLQSAGCIPRVPKQLERTVGPRVRRAWTTQVSRAWREVLSEIALSHPDAPRCGGSNTRLGGEQNFGQGDRARGVISADAGSSIWSLLP